MRRALAAVACAAGLVAGCGGAEPGSQPSAATVIPASAPVYASLDTDLESEQWSRVEALLGRFPEGDRVFAELRARLSKEGFDLDEDVMPALGPTLEVAVLGLAEGEPLVVFLTQPDDAAKLRALLAEADEPPAVAEIDGWTAIAEDEAALERLRRDREGGTLAQADRFEQAMDALPDATLARLYVDAERAGDAVKQLGPLASPALADAPDWFVAGVEAREDGVLLVGEASGGQGLPETGGLLDTVPEGAFGFLNVPLTGAGARLDEAPPDLLEGLERALGISVQELAGLFDGELLLYARAAALVPEVTLVLETDDEARARDVVETLAGRLGAQPRERTIEGVEALELPLGMVSLFAAAFDGKLVLTTLPAGIEAAREGDGGIRDDEAYERAVDAAGLEDGEQVLLFLDLDEALGLADAVSGLAGDRLDAETRAKLEPLSTLVAAAGERDGRTTFRLYLGLD